LNWSSFNEKYHELKLSKLILEHNQNARINIAVKRNSKVAIADITISLNNDKSGFESILLRDLVIFTSLS
jgi:hypothetical protein